MFKFLCVLFFIGIATSIDVVDLSEDLLQDILLILSGIEIDYSGTCPDFNSSLVTFYLFNPQHKNVSINLTKNNLDAVDPTLDTKVLIHGWTATHKSWGLAAKDAYLANGQYNVILVDWSVYSYMSYAEAFCELPKVGSLVASVILDLQDKVNLNINKTHIIGHSLGAQTAGYVGQAIMNLNSGKKVGRITGLDAAGPGFFYVLPPRTVNERLSKDDAYFVDAIHTSQTTFGYLGPYATVDFYPHCGVLQAGCVAFAIPKNISQVQDLLPDISCSHSRATEFFIESISSYDFIANNCLECVLYELGACKNNEELIMGEHCTPPASENNAYFLETNPERPFAKGAKKEEKSKGLISSHLGF